MKRFWCGLLLSVCAATGCINLPLLSTAPPPPVATPEPQPSRPPAPVTADQVHDDNAWEVKKALEKELDREIYPE